MLLVLFLHYSIFIPIFDALRHSSTKCAKARPLYCPIALTTHTPPPQNALYSASPPATPPPSKSSPLHKAKCRCAPYVIVTCKPPYSHPLQIPSMSTPSIIYFPLVLQALFFSLFRVVSRLSQCVARTFCAVSNIQPRLDTIISDPAQSPYSPESRLAFWNATAGNALRTLLEWTSYPQHLQIKYDNFLTTFVIPRLGPSPHMIDPSRLQSQLQDDHTPLEFSCVLESDACGKVQCYAEPLNPMDGSSTPRETWMANLQNMLVAGGVRDADLSWCGTCADTLTIDPPSVLPDSGVHIQFAMGTLTKKTIPSGPISKINQSSRW
jgi:hypothetical protein